MRITATVKKTLFLILIFFFAGCSNSGDARRAREQAQQSRSSYQQALAQYKKLVASSPEKEQYLFELGTLYYDHGDFAAAADIFKTSTRSAGKKMLAISLYRLGEFTRALEVFNASQLDDAESCYYYGLTCERLNLFDQALAVYRKVKDARFREKALLRIEAIEKQAHAATIAQIDPAVARIIAGAPKKDAYPQAGAFILYADEKTEITEQDTEISSLHYVVKILNERGKEAFAETGIHYDSTYERVELEYARTIRPDGVVVEVGRRHIRDVSKYLNFPLYSNARVTIISFPEVAEGSCIEYKLKVYRSQLVTKNDFNLAYPLKMQEPVVEALFEISVPESKALTFKNMNTRYNDSGAPLAPAVEKKPDRLFYRWHFKNIPQIIAEARMPAETEINPVILVSSFRSWEQVYQWWWGLARDKIAADSAIKKKVAELTKTASGDQEKARRLYNFCAQEIRYVAVEYGQAGYEPHPAADIFRNKYGDCKDQAILLVAMLKEAGLSAYPVLIPTRDCYNADKDFPSVIFDHCIAAVLIEGKLTFMDPTAQTCSFGDLPRADQGRTVLVVKDKEYVLQETPSFGAQNNRIRQELKISVAADGTIQAQKTIATSGIYDHGQRYWLLYTQPELVQETLKEKIQEVSIGGALERYEIQHLDTLDTPIVLRYYFSGPEFLTSAGNLRIMPQLATLDTSVVAKDRRAYPVDFGFCDRRQTLFEIAIPEGFVIKYMPASVSSQTPWFRFEARYELRGKNLVVFTQVMEMLKEQVREDEYPAFKSAFEKVAKDIKQRIVIEKVK